MAATNIAAESLKQYIERIERLELDKIQIQDHIREVYAEAENSGFDVKAMKQIVRLRKMDSEDREEQEMLLNVYKRALGMYVDEYELSE